MIPQSFIQELLARVDIVEVVGRHVKLKKGGANWLGLCPFHGEKSPSFTVSPTKQFYHCFGCGAHGSAIGFLMEHGGMSYPDAIHELARSAGLTVPEERGAADDARRRDPDLLETIAAAARFYKQRLKDSPHAIDYLKGRGVSGETAARFGIGYAPEGWRSLEAAVPDYSARTLVESGLVIEPEPEPDAEPAGQGPGRRKRYDRFRDRIMFPIRNPRGQTIGFGGRVLGQGEPKYLNSPETPLFSKGRELYGLFEGRDAIRAADCVIVVEGYMDVVMLAQHGVRNAVATLGTATTAQHVQKLLRLVDRVVFAFDGDAAGRRAAWRALEACLPLAGVLLVLAAAAGNAAYQTLTRAQAQADSPAVQVLWSGLVGATIMTATAPLWWSASAWPETPPTSFDWAVFAAIGPLGAAGHLLLARAYRLAQASRLAPWAYTQMLLSIALGWAVFGDVPDAVALVGMAMIAASPQVARLGGLGRRSRAA